MPKPCTAKQFAIHGAGLICMEATAMVLEGRISSQDNGIWSDEHIPNLKRIVDFVHTQGGIMGIQLARAGRKAGIRALWAAADLKGNIRDPSGSNVTTNFMVHMGTLFTSSYPLSNERTSMVALSIINPASSSRS